MTVENVFLLVITFYSVEIFQYSIIHYHHSDLFHLLNQIKTKTVTKSRPFHQLFYMTILEKNLANKKESCLYGACNLLCNENMFMNHSILQ